MSEILTGLAAVLDLQVLGFLAVGVSLGAVFGSLPGLTAAMGGGSSDAADFLGFRRAGPCDAARDLLRRHSGGGDPSDPDQCSRHARVDCYDVGRLPSYAQGQGRAGAGHQCVRLGRRPADEHSVPCLPRIPNRQLCTPVRPRGVLWTRSTGNQPDGGRFGKARAEGHAVRIARTGGGLGRPRPDDGISALHVRHVRVSRRDFVHSRHDRALRLGRGAGADLGPSRRQSSCFRSYRTHCAQGCGSQENARSHLQRGGSGNDGGSDPGCRRGYRFGHCLGAGTEDFCELG